MKNLLVVIALVLFASVALAEKPTLEAPTIAPIPQATQVPPPIWTTTYNGTSFTFEPGVVSATMAEPGYLSVPVTLTAGDHEKPVYYRCHGFGGSFPLGSVVFSDANGNADGLITGTTVQFNVHFIGRALLKPGVYFGWSPFWLSTDPNFPPQHLRYLRLHVRLVVGSDPGSISVALSTLGDVAIPYDPNNEITQTVLRYEIRNKLAEPVTVTKMFLGYSASRGFADRVSYIGQWMSGQMISGPFDPYVRANTCVGNLPCLGGITLLTDPFIAPPGLSEVSVTAIFDPGISPGDTIRFWIDPSLIIASNASGESVRFSPDVILTGPVLTVGQ